MAMNPTNDLKKNLKITNPQTLGKFPDVQTPTASQYGEHSPLVNSFPT